MYTAVRTRITRRLSGVRRDAGFSLVESVVAMVLFMIMSAAGITAVIAGQNATQASRTRVAQTNIARGDLNQARAQPTPSPTTYTATAGANAYVVTRNVQVLPTPSSSGACPTGSLRRIDVTVRWSTRSVNMTTAVAC